jgi:hypothetical protein
MLYHKQVFLGLNFVKKIEIFLKMVNFFSNSEMEDFEPESSSESDHTMNSDEGSDVDMIMQMVKKKKKKDEKKKRKKEEKKEEKPHKKRRKKETEFQKPVERVIETAPTPVVEDVVVVPPKKVVKTTKPWAMSVKAPVVQEFLKNNIISIYESRVRGDMTDDDLKVDMSIKDFASDILPILVHYAQPMLKELPDPLADIPNPNTWTAEERKTKSKFRRRDVTIASLFCYNYLAADMGFPHHEKKGKPVLSDL